MKTLEYEMKTVECSGLTEIIVDQRGAGCAGIIGPNGPEHIGFASISKKEPEGQCKLILTEDPGRSTVQSRQTSYEVPVPQELIELYNTHYSIDSFIFPSQDITEVTLFRLGREWELYGLYKQEV